MGKGEGTGDIGENTDGPSIKQGSKDIVRFYRRV